jgi:hypothetical protein
LKGNITEEKMKEKFRILILLFAIIRALLPTRNNKDGSSHGKKRYNKEIAVMFSIFFFVLSLTYLGVGSAAIPGDLDGDGQICRTDLDIILNARNQSASGPDDTRDLDSDGMITVLDARKLLPICTRPRCHCIEVGYTQGDMLEPRPRGFQPDPNVPRLYPEDVEEWLNMFALAQTYDENYEIEPGNEESLYLNLAGASKIFVKVFASGNQPEKLLVQLYQNENKLYWVGEPFVMEDPLLGPVAVLNSSIVITADIFAASEGWRIGLLNSGNKSVSAEVSVAVAALQ